MLRICEGLGTNKGKGFHMTFANGCTVSVQWGVHNYCTNRYGKDGEQSITAECAAWNDDGWILPAESDDVHADLSADEVAEFINKVANYKSA